MYEYAFHAPHYLFIFHIKVERLFKVKLSLETNWDFGVFSVVALVKHEPITKFLLFLLCLNRHSTHHIIYLYFILAVGVALRATPTPSWWGASRPPKPPRARKSLRAILVTRHCSCVPVFHL